MIYQLTNNSNARKTLGKNTFYLNSGGGGDNIQLANVCSSALLHKFRDYSTNLNREPTTLKSNYYCPTSTSSSIKPASTALTKASIVSKRQSPLGKKMSPTTLMINVPGDNNNNSKCNKVNKKIHEIYYATVSPFKVLEETLKRKFSNTIISSLKNSEEQSTFKKGQIFQKDSISTENSTTFKSSSKCYISRNDQQDNGNLEKSAHLESILLQGKKAKVATIRTIPGNIQINQDSGSLKMIHEHYQVVDSAKHSSNHFNVEPSKNEKEHVKFINYPAVTMSIITSIPTSSGKGTSNNQKNSVYLLYNNETSKKTDSSLHEYKLFSSQMPFPAVKNHLNKDTSTRKSYLEDIEDLNNPGTYIALLSAEKVLNCTSSHQISSTVNTEPGASLYLTPPILNVSKPSNNDTCRRNAKMVKIGAFHYTSPEICTKTKDNHDFPMNYVSSHKQLQGNVSANYSLSATNKYNSNVDVKATTISRCSVKELWPSLLHIPYQTISSIDAFNSLACFSEVMSDHTKNLAHNQLTQSPTKEEYHYLRCNSPSKLLKESITIQTVPNNFVGEHNLILKDVVSHSQGIILAKSIPDLSKSSSIEKIYPIESSHTKFLKDKIPNDLLCESEKTESFKDAAVTLSSNNPNANNIYEKNKIINPYTFPGPIIFSILTPADLYVSHLICTIINIAQQLSPISMGCSAIYTKYDLNWDPFGLTNDCTDEIDDNGKMYPSHPFPPNFLESAIHNHLVPDIRVFINPLVTCALLNIWISVKNK